MELRIAAWWLLCVVLCLVAVPLLFLRLDGEQRRSESGPEVRLWLVEEERLLSLPLEEYVAGVVMAEMPPSFPKEALKAQAVAARTYVWRRLVRGQKVSTHPKADVSSDFRESQAWHRPERLMRQWGWLRFRYYQARVVAAVRATHGQVLVYQGAPALTVYHSTSGGVTASAADYWGQEIPYLQRVASPFEAESPHCERVVRLPIAHVVGKVLGRQGTNIHALVDKLSAAGRGAMDNLREKLRIVERTPEGRVLTLDCFGTAVSGRRFRELLGLPSTWFSLEVAPEAGEIVFHCRGFGHGVGMSQYGAQGYASRGWSYRRILSHYYPGTSLVQVY